MNNDPGTWGQACATINVNIIRIQFRERVCLHIEVARLLYTTSSEIIHHGRAQLLFINKII